MLKSLLLAAILAHAPAPAQIQEPVQPRSDLQVYLVTMDPGNAAFEFFGHNAIWIRDPARGTDIAYNWGMFDFDKPNFYTNFLKGLLIYSMGAYDMTAMVDAYIRDNRSVHVQELSLTPAQKQALYDYVEWNNRPENRDYRYHYYRDNCSTRVRDVLDRAMSGTLRKSLEPRSTNSTDRSETRRLSQRDPLVYTGLLIAMGPLIDRPLNAWEEAFIPMRLRESVRTVNLDGRPLVMSERTLFEAQRPPTPAEPPNWLVWYLLIGVALAGVLMLLGSLRRRWARFGFIAIAGLFEFVIGLVGTIMLLLWLFTDHDVTYRNENLMQANPLSLALMVALLALLLRRSWALRTAGRIALVVAGFSMIGFLAQALPQLDQVNGEIIALLLPVHMAVAWVLARASPLEANEMGVP